jgi:transcriptional regulator with GAF, ATPase, and Fis domain
VVERSLRHHRKSNSKFRTPVGAPASWLCHQENFIERAVILSRGPGLRAPLAEIRQDAAQTAGGATLEEVELEHILRVLRESGGVVTTAATRLGLHRTTLNAMMRKLRISRKDL